MNAFSTQRAGIRVHTFGRRKFTALLAMLAAAFSGAALVPVSAHADAPQTSTIGATISVGGNPQQPKFNRSGSRAYVANLGSASVSVINTTTRKVIATIPTAAAPRTITVNRTGTRVYVGSADTQNNGTVTVIDAVRNVALGRISVGKFPGQLEVCKDGRYLYVGHLFGLSVVDTTTNRITADVPLPGVPRELLLNEAGTRLYTTTVNGNAGDVLVIDATKNALTAAVHMTYEPGEIALTPGGDQLYVGGGTWQSFTVVATATNKIAKSVKYSDLGPDRGRLTLSPNGRHIYTYDSSFDLRRRTWLTSIYDVDPATGKAGILATFDGEGGGLAASPQGSSLYLARLDRSAVTVIALHPAKLSTAPVPIITGTVARGHTLAAKVGSWRPAPVTLRYQWKRSGMSIAGATRATYVLGRADVGKTITVTVTGSKSGYSALSRTSAKTKAVRAR